MKGSKRALAMTSAISGFLYGLFMGLVGIVMTGAGHGWCSGVWSGLAALVIPVFAIGLVYQQLLVGRLLLLCASLGAVGLNSLILEMSWDEGKYYLVRAWSVQGGFFIWVFWLILWLSWQVIVLILLVLGPKFVSRDS